MKDLNVTITSLENVCNDVFLLSFKAPYFVQSMKPGQFVEIRIDSPELNLRRPFCIHHTKGDTVYILFRIRGTGTRILSRMKAGDTLDVLGPLGNGFTTGNNERQILVAGGMGVAPLVSLAAKLKESRNSKSEIRNEFLVLLGARTKDEVLCAKDFKDYGFEVRIATDDGSEGFKGNAVQLLEKVLSTGGRSAAPADLYVCGPSVMFRETARVIAGYPDIHAQASFEQFMGCGIGTCRACVIKTRSGYKRVCKDGPVFDLREIVF
jgi:dihydroorotate dehydrogenase electron transfer subunit